MPPQLTIAIPTYNRAALLKRALESTLIQTSDKVAILVSDNGSTDETRSILEKYADPRLTIIRHANTMSRAEHGTFIFNYVKTEFITILSDDDWLEPDFAAEVIQLYHQHPDISFAYTGCWEHYYDVKILALTGPIIETPKDFFTHFYAKKRNVSWCACAMRIKDIMPLTPQPENIIMGDMYFWTKIGKKANIGCINKALSHYTILRENGESHSQIVPVMAWGNESLATATEVIESLKPVLDDYEIKTIRNNAKLYAAHSISLRFLFGRLYGMSVMESLGILPVCFRFNGWNLNGICRVVAACILPRTILRLIVVRMITIMAAKRSIKK